MFLPKVDREICEPLFIEMHNREDWLDNFIDRLAEDNPLIAEFLVNYLDTLDKDQKAIALWPSVIVYRMLENQAEADKMNADFI